MAKIGEINKEHSVCIKDRSEMTLSGVGEVVSFSDNVVFLKTSRGDLQIKGNNLRIGKLNTETGELCISGFVTTFRYGKDRGGKGGIFEGLLK